MTRNTRETPRVPFSIARREDRAVDAVGLGLNARDRRIVLSSFPERDKRAWILESYETPGGQAAIAMATVARLGGRARYLGKFGDDLAGRENARALAEAGVDVSRALTATGVPNQFAIILLEEKASARTILWHRPEALRMRPDQIDPATIADSRVLLVDGHDIPACVRAARIARDAGAIVVLDAEEVEEGTDELVGLSNVVFGDEDFPGRFTGEPDLEQALARIASLGPAALGPKVVGATLGPRGAVVLAHDVFVRSPAIRVDAVDTTGAGDVFHGAFVHGMLEGWTLERILAFSNACAGISTTRRGGIERIPTREEVEGV